MPKPKNFNISEFLDDAAANVVPQKNYESPKNTEVAEEPVSPQHPSPAASQSQPTEQGVMTQPNTSMPQSSLTQSVVQGTPVAPPNAYGQAQVNIPTPPPSPQQLPFPTNEFPGQAYYGQMQAQPTMPSTYPYGQPATGYPQAQPAYPVMPNGYMPAAAYPTPQPAEASKGQRGRKKSMRTIPRQNGKVVYLEIEADAALARISVLERVDKQDIIRTALDEFLKNHYDGSNLDASGSELLTAYIQKTTEFQE